MTPKASTRRDIEIREAVIPDDLPVVRDLFREYAVALGIDLCFQGFDEELRLLPGRYARPAGGIWLALAGEEVAGCVALRPIDSKRAEMKRLFVRPGFRGTGLGRLLTEHLLRDAAKVGYHRVCLDTLPSMGSAIALYKSLGFIQIEPYCHNPVPGALFLERVISDEPTDSSARR